MSHLLTWLTENVRTAVRKCGALGASIYVPTPWDPAAPGILVQVGEQAPLPELASLDAAVAFVARSASLPATPSAGDNTTVGLVASAAPEGCLIPIPLIAPPGRRTPFANADSAESLKQLRRLSDHGSPAAIVGWVGLRFAEQPECGRHPAGWRAVLELATVLASTYVCFHGILSDPVTGLPGRGELNGWLRAELERARTHDRPFSLLFAKVEDVERVNERFGRRAGDTVLREFLNFLYGSVRSSDVVMRYGATVFALPLRDVGAAGAVRLGEKIRQRIHDCAFLDGTLPLPCAVGIVSCAGPEDAALQPLDLLRRANQALLASRREGYHRAVLWTPEGDMARAEYLDPLIGVFTGQTDKDYRNMRLLWEVLEALSAAPGADLAHVVVARMFSLFAVSRAALFQLRDGGGLQLIEGQQRSGDAGITALGADRLLPEEWQLNESALASLAPRQAAFDASVFPAGPPAPRAFAVPLVIDGRALGSLYLLGGSDTLKIDESDFPVLASVASQLALAVDRQRLADEQRLREQHEQDLLKAEFNKLRSALHRARFVFRSEVMTDLLKTTKRVAATEVTVLITGESGTGKEMLAQMVHELGLRREKPLVIVDCGAIPASLMDSELFGHERGAYTGAERRTTGRLAQADGGTVFLDEIGELPLEVQAKLLRFVQERTITMVGGTRPQRVDVRIIAATNRDLEREVRAGRFRDDLFHRLNVVRLRIPPLRARRDDIPILARHFLGTFAVQHGKVLRGFDASAEQLLVEHGWPGNVRELENSILQAVVLAEGDVLTRDDLQLRNMESAAPLSRDAGRAAIEWPSVGVSRQRDEQASGGDTAPPFDEAWRVLQGRVAEAIDAALAGTTPGLCPFGRWIARDLVLEAHEQAGRVAARAAAAVGLPETTFSRRLHRAEMEAAVTRQPDSWRAIRSGLSRLLRSDGRPSGSLAERVDDLVFHAVVTRVPHDVGTAAQLLGLSPATMKRRILISQTGTSVSACA
jgi:diguanylate cyclase (GGDEF)-like protein